MGRAAAGAEMRLHRDHTVGHWRVNLLTDVMIGAVACEARPTEKEIRRRNRAQRLPGAAILL